MILPQSQLLAKIRGFLSADDTKARDIFHDSRDRKCIQAKSIPLDVKNIRYVSYRPLDRWYLYNHYAYGDFLRPDLQVVWGTNNVGLYAMPGGTGQGPAVWCHGNLPDYHAFSGRGGYAFPLYDRRPHVEGSNISPALLQGLSLAYGELVSAEDVFDAILGLLSAKSYTLRFAEDLEDVFPHVPFPARQRGFQNAVRVGRDIRAVQTFARQPSPTYLHPSLVCVASEPDGAVTKVEYADGAITLCKNGSGRITGIPSAVWNFSVSGYRIVPRWLEARCGLPVDLGFVREFRDVCARIAELLDLFNAADIVLEETLHETLTREAVGLAPVGQEANDRRD